MRSACLNALVALVLLLGLAANGMLICKKDNQRSKIEMSCGDSCGIESVEKSKENKAEGPQLSEACTDLQISMESVFRQDRDDLIVVNSKVKCSSIVKRSPILQLKQGLYASKRWVVTESPPIPLFHHFQSTVLLI